MKKLFFSMFIVLVMVLGIFPMSAMAATATVYTGSANGWGSNMVYIKSVTVNGVDVSGNPNWNGNVCNITLAEGTLTNSKVTFNFEVGFDGNPGQAPQFMGTFRINLAGNNILSLDNSGRATGTVTLNGTATTEVPITISGNGIGGNNITKKTFVFNIPNPNNVPELKDSEKAEESSTVVIDTPYNVDLRSLFTDPDGDAFSYKVSIDDAGAVDAAVEDGVYTYNCPVEGDHKLVFTAVDIKGGVSEDCYTVYLKVTPKNTSDNNYSTVIVLPDNVRASFYTLGGKSGEPGPGTALTSEAEDNTFTVAVPDEEDTLYIDFEDGYLVTKVTKDGRLTLREIEIAPQDRFETTVNGSVTVADTDNCPVYAENGKYYMAVGKNYVADFTPVNLKTHKIANAEQLIANDTEEFVIPVDYNNQKIIVTPKDATAQLFSYNKYYNSTEFPCCGTEDKGEGRVSHYFAGVTTTPGGGATIYRVTYKDYIVKAGWSDADDTVTVTYSENDLKSDARVDYSSTNEKNKDFADDSILLNVNSRNHLSLPVGQEYTLKGYRTWEIIATSSINWIIEPDFHFDVVWETETGVITLENKENLMTGGESWQTITAKKPGTAIIEVTYDAIDVRGGINYFTGVYGASDPYRSGLVVVTVGESDGSVDFGIESFAGIGTKVTSNGSDNAIYNSENKKAWDAEFDTLYFTGDCGELKFSPSDNSSIIEVAVSNDNGKQWTVLKRDNGLYTAKILSGNNIIRVTTEEGKAYQVVRGKKITYALSEVPGNENSDEDGVIEAGEKVRVTLNGLHIPIPKMSGSYNPGYGSTIHINYSMNSDTVSGPGAQYDFHKAANFIDIIVPEDAEDEICLTGGYIGLGVTGLPKFVSGGESHRDIPDDGCNTRKEGDDNAAGDAPTTWHTRCILPDITIELGTEDAGNTPPEVRPGAPTSASLVLSNDVYNYVINLATDVFVDADVADELTYTVKVNSGAESTVDNGYYKLEQPEAGTYELFFTVNDGESTASHTIVLTVTGSSNPGQNPNPGPGQDEDEAEGYVYVSFEDFAVRKEGERGVLYPNPLGVIVPKTAVPFYEGDTIADVTIRLLDSKNMTYEYVGTTKSNFYLASIGNFTVDGTYYENIGEKDAGAGSGWMITWKDWFINKGASEFNVEEGDIVEWKYTCQLGSDIGHKDWQDKGEIVDDTTTEVKFTDVSEKDYYYEAVKWAAELGITKGTSDASFSPNASCTRAQMITFLWRAAGSPKANSTECSFTDINSEDYYFEALLWAIENGIVNGISDSEFVPNGDCNRGQMATLLYRSAKSPSVSGENFFNDINNDAYYNDAVIWAANQGITNGTSESTFSPDEFCTRGQMVTFLYRYLSN